MRQKVSVIIPTFNMADTLPDAIDSALPQADEVLVIDDSSTDDTPRLLRDMRHMKLKTVRQKSNQGVVTARNLGVMVSECSWFLPLDADDRLADNIIPTIIAASDSKTFVYGDWMEKHPDHDDLSIPIEAPPIGMVNRKNVARATFLFSRTMWESVNGYDADFEGIGAEDWAFMLALLEAGFKGVRLEIPVYHYRKKDNGRAALVKQHEAQIMSLFKRKYPRTMGV